MSPIPLGSDKRYETPFSKTVSNRALTLTEWIDWGEGVEILEGAAGDAPIIRPRSNTTTVDIDLRLFALGTGLVYVNGDVPMGIASFTAKGQVLVGTGANTYTQVTAVNDYDVLRADAAEASGTKWGPMTLENRTSDPGSPEVGQLWLRVDL